MVHAVRNYLSSFRGRFVVLSALLFACSSLSVAGLYFYQSRNLFHLEAEKRGHSIADGLATRASHAISHRSDSALEAAMNQISENGEVLYAIIQDSRGQLIAQTAMPGVNLASIRGMLASSAWQPDREASLAYTTGDGRRFSNFTMPVVPEENYRPAGSPESSTDRLGTVHVGLLTESTLSHIESAFWISILIWVAMFLMGFTGILIVTRWAFRPLEEMAMVARRVSAGDLSQRVEVRSRDEIGQLGLAFNEMTEGLAASRRALADSESTRRAEKLRTVGQMASGVAHDFNNVLASIIGRIQLLRFKGDKLGIDGEIGDSLEIIERAALDGAETVRRIQEFSREETQRNLQRSDLNRLLKDAVEITRPRWQHETRQAGTRVDVALDLEEIPLVACIPSELREAFTNIILNAVDAMTEGGLLTIRARRDGERIRVLFRDTGPGIPESIVDRLFEPFFTTKGVKGNGLGLSIVYGILQRHGGTLTAANAPQGGAEFLLHLPVAETALPDQVEETVMGNRPMRILVGDDEAGVRGALVDILRALGHTVTEAVDGTGTLREFMSHPIDLVFTDLGMPDISGWEVARSIRQQNPKVPIVLITGWGNQIDSEEAARSGVTRVMAKPFTFQKISSAIAEIQGMQRAA